MGVTNSGAPPRLPEAQGILGRKARHPAPLCCTPCSPGTPQPLSTPDRARVCCAGAKDGQPASLLSVWLSSLAAGGVELGAPSWDGALVQVRAGGTLAFEQPLVVCRTPLHHSGSFRSRRHSWRTQAHHSPPDLPPSSAHFVHPIPSPTHPANPNPKPKLSPVLLPPRSPQEAVTFLILLLYAPAFKAEFGAALLPFYGALASRHKSHPLTKAMDRLTVQVFNSELGAGRAGLCWA